MEPERRCTKCGQVIPWGQQACPVCTESGNFLWRLGRDTFLLLTLILLLVLFVVTGFASRAYHVKEQALGEEWFGQGMADLSTGKAPAAVEDFRTALAYSRENSLYQLRLAEALAAAGRVAEARAYLVSLWDREPGNGRVNLELARLAVQAHDVPQALRYFHNAIYGEWPEDPVGKRRAAHLELAEFLLQAGQKARAQSELIALATDLPNDPELQTEVGSLLLQSGEYDHALQLFRRALRENPHSDVALAGAGEVYFHQNEFLEAQRYLSRAVAQNPHLTHAASLLATTREALDIDPFGRRLSGSQRAERALQAFNQAMTRLEACAAQRGVNVEEAGGSNDLQKLYHQAVELERQLRKPALARDPDLVNSAMDVVFNIERTTEGECGEPQGLDRALLLLARAQGGARP